MNQPMGHRAPHVDTHIAERVELPPEPSDDEQDRPDEPTPSLWQNSVKVVHKLSQRTAVVVRVDWNMNMFRAYYPDERAKDGTMGRFSSRREWEHCHDWLVQTTYSPAELDRQAAHTRLEAELDDMARTDPKGLALAQALCDDPDPARNFAKLQKLREAGLIKSSAEVMTAAVEKGKKS